MKKLIIILALLTCVGCMVGPNHKTPKSEMPSAYIEEKKNDDATILSLKNYWKTFEDPLLNKLIDIAISNNYDFKIAVEKVEEARSYYRIKKADLFPEINLNASAIRLGLSSNIAPTSFIPTKTFNIFQTGFDAIWEIDIFGRLRREKQAAKYELQSMIEDSRDIYVILTSDVAKNYIDICSLNNIIKLTQDKINAQETILKLASNKNQTGLNSKINTENQIIFLKQENENLIYYNTLVKQLVFRLAVLLGQTPEDFQEQYFSKFTNIIDAKEKIKIDLPSTLLQNRPDIRSAERTLARATSKIGAAIARYFPSFSLNGNTDFQASKINNLFSSSSFVWSLGSIMSWPIITFGRISANVDVSKAVQRQALLSYKNTILNALMDVEGSMVAYYNEQDTLQNITEEVLANTIITELEKNKYETGLNDQTIYLENKKILLEKKIKEIQSKRSLANNLIALYKALGGGEWNRESYNE
jgi:outer membrane protein, multidrug efflux system